MRMGLIGNKEKAIVHIAKQQLAMTEKEYRDALLKVGVASSKSLTFPQYEKFLDNLMSLGFTITGKTKIHRIVPKKATWDREPMLRKIGVLLTGMKLSWNYADGIAQKMFKVDKVVWCFSEQLHSIVAALEYKRRRMNYKTKEGE